MEFETAKSPLEQVEHRHGQFRIVAILEQFLNALTLSGDVSLAFGNALIDLHQVLALALGPCTRYQRQSPQLLAGANR
jgi:hypothetical protein